MLSRTTIAEQMDIELEEVIGSSALLSLGMNSLMSICILGILREKTGLDLPSSLFVDYSSLNDTEIFLGFNEPNFPILAKLSKRQKGISTAPSTLSLHLLDPPQAVSILMQGKSKTAAKGFFLFPDGSGSATLYASIPALDPRNAIYGLSSFFMINPSGFNIGIGAASISLTEIRRRRPSGHITRADGPPVASLHTKLYCNSKPKASMSRVSSSSIRYVHQSRTTSFPPARVLGGCWTFGRGTYTAAALTPTTLRHSHQSPCELQADFNQRQDLSAMDAGHLGSARSL